MRTNKRWAAATGALVIGAGSAAIWVPTAQAAGTAAENTVIRTCKSQVDGEKVKLRATLHLRASGDNDVTAVDLRATDNGESGGFRNADVNLRKLLLRVKDESGQVVAKVSTRSSPFAVDLAEAGDEVGKVHAEARFRSGDRIGIVACKFTFKDTSGDGGAGNS